MRSSRAAPGRRWRRRTAPKPPKPTKNGTASARPRRHAGVAGRVTGRKRHPLGALAAGTRRRRVRPPEQAQGRASPRTKPASRALSPRRTYSEHPQRRAVRCRPCRPARRATTGRPAAAWVPRRVPRARSARSPGRSAASRCWPGRPTPPGCWPTTAAMPPVAPNMAIARSRCVPVVVACTVASTRHHHGGRCACSILRADEAVRGRRSPQASEATVNAAMPMRKSRLRPKASPSRPWPWTPERAADVGQGDDEEVGHRQERPDQDGQQRRGRERGRLGHGGRSARRGAGRRRAAGRVVERSVTADPCVHSASVPQGVPERIHPGTGSTW